MHIIVTLAEFDHIKGALVLYNSLKINGFEGTFVIGYRNIASLSEEIRNFVRESDDIVLEKINPSRHLTNYKPNFMKLVANNINEATTITYLDPDIIVNCPVNLLHHGAKMDLLFVEM